ncbi:MAG: ribonuclease P protein subunit [Candidatus Woesearchaeota archaeon]
MRPHQRPLIGKRAAITEARNPSLKGHEGVVRDETKHTLTIGRKKVIKEQVTIKVDGAVIDGRTIAKTPTERIKVHKP